MPDERRTYEIEEALGLLTDIGRLAHGFGVSSARLQSDLEGLARSVGLEGTFQVTPQSIIYAVSRPGAPRQEIHVQSLLSPGFDLGKLSHLSDITRAGLENAMTMRDCRRSMAELKDAPGPWGPAAVALGHVLCGAGFGTVMGLSGPDVVVAGLMSLVVCALSFLAGMWAPLGPRLEIVASFVVSALVAAIAAVSPVSTVTPTIVAGLVVLLPGYAITLGFGELTSGLVQSGAQRLMAGLVSALKLFLGATLGFLAVSSFLVVPEPVSAAGMPALFKWLAVFALVLGLSFIFQVLRRDLLWVILVGLGTYTGMVIGGAIGPWQGSFLGTLGLGLIAGISASALKRSPTVAFVPSLMVLVPGATVMLGLQEGAVEGTTEALATEWVTFVNVCAILAGLLIADSTVRVFGAFSGRHR